MGSIYKIKSVSTALRSSTVHKPQQNQTIFGNARNQKIGSIIAKIQTRGGLQVEKCKLYLYAMPKLGPVIFRYYKFYLLSFSFFGSDIFVFL